MEENMEFFLYNGGCYKSYYRDPFLQSLLTTSKCPCMLILKLWRVGDVQRINLDDVHCEVHQTLAAQS